MKNVLEYFEITTSKFPDKVGFTDIDRQSTFVQTMENAKKIGTALSGMGSLQEWASTYPLFHWGPIAWSFYILLAVAFGFMMFIRGRKKQRFSEACRPLLEIRLMVF